MWPLPSMALEPTAQQHAGEGLVVNGCHWSVLKIPALAQGWDIRSHLARCRTGHGQQRVIWHQAGAMGIGDVGAYTWLAGISR